MKTVKLLISIIIILLASAFTALQAISWKIKESYSVKWDGGSFRGLKATILFDELHPEKSEIFAIIDPRTVKTGNDQSTAHAKEALEADKYPVISFVSSSVKKIADAKYEATGNLTLKGVIKEIKLPFTFDSKKDHAEKFPFILKETFHGSFTIVPKDFNVTMPGTPPKITIELDIPVIK